MASLNDETFYRIKKGKAVIIKINEFDDKTNKPLKGHDQDEINIEKHLKALQFTTEKKNNLKKKEMKRYLREVAEQKCFDCFIGVILSHGGPGTIDSKDDTIDVSTILAPFKTATTLLGKPKIFFIQACRGVSRDDGVLGVEGDGDGDWTPSSMTWLPVEADFLVAYSTVEGYTSWVTEEGSYFIHTLCQAMDDYIIHRDSSLPPVDLMTILTRVNQNVAKYFIAENDKIGLKKQMPCVVSTLRKDIFLPIRNTPEEEEMET